MTRALAPSRRALLSRALTLGMVLVVPGCDYENLQHPDLADRFLRLMSCWNDRVQAGSSAEARSPPLSHQRKSPARRASTLLQRRLRTGGRSWQLQTGAERPHRRSRALDARPVPQPGAIQPDHAPDLHRGLVRRRSVERPEAQRLPCPYWRRYKMPLRLLPLRRRLLRQHRHAERAAPANHSGARLPGRTAYRAVRHSRAPAHSHQARLQEPEIHRRHRCHQRLRERLLGGSGLELVQRVIETARERGAGHPRPHLDLTLKLQDRKEAHS